MYRPRVIPCLLLKGLGLVKSIRFKDYIYIGDPINAVKIFNDKHADELVFLDILATREKRTVNLELIKKIGDECNMPFAVGGGIRSIENIREILNAGAEKVVINSYASENPEFIKQASGMFGSSTIMVSIDVKNTLFGREYVFSQSGTKSTGFNPVTFSRLMEQNGAGEIIINSIERDGTMSGYDLDLIKRISDAVSVPVIALGGAGKLEHFHDAVNIGKASAVAAGSFFVFFGSRKAVLISFPSQKELIQIFS
jgi:imidazole glycerol-phosphate synthase subunit HisF